MVSAQQDRGLTYQQDRGLTYIPGAELVYAYGRLPERIRTKIEVGLGCWEWRAARTGGGYGYIHWDGRTCLAHRVVYELLRGPIDAGLVIDHLCRNRGCVNPVHLEPVTERVNILRGNSPWALGSKQTHCKRGHPFDEENTYVRPDRGARVCRACLRPSWDERNARARAARAARRLITVGGA